jgi:hypothetical protein
MEQNSKSPSLPTLQAALQQYSVPCSRKLAKTLIFSVAHLCHADGVFEEESSAKAQDAPPPAVNVLATSSTTQHSPTAVTRTISKRKSLSWTRSRSLSQSHSGKTS